MTTRLVIASATTPLATKTVRAVAATNGMMRLIVHPSSIAYPTVGEEVSASGRRRKMNTDHDPFLPLSAGR
jgi:hypothetical protein